VSSPLVCAAAPAAPPLAPLRLSRPMLLLVAAPPLAAEPRHLPEARSKAATTATLVRGASPPPAILPCHGCLPLAMR
jgi:hypothetical protein